MRVVSAHHVTDHRGALAVLLVGAEAILPHRINDPAMHRLHPVANIRQRSAGDDGKRVVQVSGLGDLMEIGAIFPTWGGGRPSGTLAAAASTDSFTAGVPEITRRSVTHPRFLRDF